MKKSLKTMWYHGRSGGTRDFVVPSCKACQNILSKIEAAASRKSILAIHALASGVKPRHPDREASGVLKPKYFLAPMPSGGYGESVLRAGGLVESLPSFEIKVAAGEAPVGRPRGPSPEKAQRLLRVFRSALKKTPTPDGYRCSIAFAFDLEESISTDPAFWPRIVLLPSDRLLLRARNPIEMKHFLNWFVPLAVSDYEVNPSTWRAEVIESGTVHSVSLIHEPKLLRRLAAKIAYGLLTSISGQPIALPEDVRFRRYILGLEVDGSEPVSEESWPEASNTSEDPHYIHLSTMLDGGEAIVCLYGYQFRVDLGFAAGVLVKPTTIICQVDGSGMRIEEK